MLMVNLNFKVIFVVLIVQKSYNLDLSDNNMEKKFIIRLFLYLTYNDDKNILPAPHWKTLKDFGGNLTIEQFRDDAIINKRIHLFTSSSYN